MFSVRSVDCELIDREPVMDIGGAPGAFGTDFGRKRKGDGEETNA
jgi:hypothetical protein